jgi:hypothetical protein
VVAATRPTFGGGIVSDFEGSNTPAGFLYGVSTRMITRGGSFGSVFYEFKSTLDCPNGNKLNNVMAFNLYGDPSTNWIAFSGTGGEVIRRWSPPREYAPSRGGNRRLQDDSIAIDPRDPGPVE